MEKKSNKLTPKQEKFCQLVVSLGNQSDALRQSYNTSNMKDESIHVKACKLCKESKISIRIAELREDLRQSNILSKDDILQHLKDILSMTKNSDKEKAIALKAIDQYTKMLGYNEAEKHEIKQDINIGFGGMENLDEDEADNEDD